MSGFLVDGRAVPLQVEATGEAAVAAYLADTPPPLAIRHAWGAVDVPADVVAQGEGAITAFVDAAAREALQQQLADGGATATVAVEDALLAAAAEGDA